MTLTEPEKLVRKLMYDLTDYFPTGPYYTGSVGSITSRIRTNTSYHPCRLVLSEVEKLNLGEKR